MPNLFLIPTLLAPEGKDHIPKVAVDVSRDLRYFIVERTRTSRRFLREIIKDFPIDDSQFLELDKHDINKSTSRIRELLQQGHDIGLMSEAGTPCIADPGAVVVHEARNAGYTIRPLSGPNSMMLALMASGLNGQEFTFHGYLPIDDHKVSSRLREISKICKKSGSTHLFIETPYRNQRLLTNIIKYVDPQLKLCIAKDLNGSSEWIDTRSIPRWNNVTLDKAPVIFCIGK